MRYLYSDGYAHGEDNTVGEGYLWYQLAIAVVIGALVILSGCDKYTSSGETVGQKVDKAIDKTNATVEKAETKISEAGKAAQKAVKAAGDTVQQKAEQVGTVVDDSAITASIKADLIKDPGMSALYIDVNTVNGEVTLKGEVQNETARERAGRIASAVSGVVKVNNSIAIKG